MDRKPPGSVVFSALNDAPDVRGHERVGFIKEPAQSQLVLMISSPKGGDDHVPLEDSRVTNPWHPSGRKGKLTVRAPPHAGEVTHIAAQAELSEPGLEGRLRIKRHTP